MAPVVFALSVLPSTATVTSLGVVTDMTRPVRPSGCERETESLAESARMPSSDRAPATVVEVVQYSLVCPSTVTVRRRPYRTTTFWPSLSRVDTAGATTSWGPTLMSWLGQHVTDGAAEQVDCGGLAVNRQVHRLVEVGEADSTGNEGHDNSGLGDTPNRTKAHSAPELARSGHRATERHAPFKEIGVLDRGRASQVRAVRGLTDPGQQPSTMTDTPGKGQILVTVTP